MTPPLAPFFEPATVAVVGASRDPAKVGGSVLANLTAAGFSGRVVPVNPRADRVQGLPTVASVRAIDGDVDLAVVVVPAADVLGVLKDCVAKGVRGAVVISAGFRESDDEGRTRETELRTWLRDQPLRVIGPNCLGWIRPTRGLNLTFAPGMPAPGRVAFVSHSGALAVAMLDWSRNHHLGFSLFASLGNQADVTETDVLRAVAADPETGVVIAYLEGVADGRAFVGALSQVAALKPVVVLKTGRSREGARAVSSHTGALAGSDTAFDAALRQAGVVRARSIEELFDLARALETQPLPSGRRLLVVSNGGGLGIVATDAAAAAGLAVTSLPEDARARLRAVLPRTASVVNPVDIVGDADAARFGNALRAATAAGVDAALVLLTAQAATDAGEVARAIVSATRGWTIPVAGAFVGGPRVAPGAATLEQAGIPCYPFPERAVAALAGMAAVVERRAVRQAPAPPGVPLEAAVRHVAALRRAEARRLGILELAPLLAAYGIPHAAPRAVATPEAAAAAAAEMGTPVALKLVSPDIVHKTEIGGVRLGLDSPAAVADAMRAMLARVAAARPAARLRGALLQPMVAPGRELLLGALRDPQFGPMVVVGAGGIWVEVFADTAARLAPVDREEAIVMLGELRMAPLLLGTRGERSVDFGALADLVSRFSRLAVDLGDFVELEVNPLVAGPGGAVAVDARATLDAAPTAVSDG
ncbi:MAG TPA: acetate--CoA ligase family protein [Methylomirabilota bacterium]|nr:acetate--CoA ligase family protein [Methylomirabilota bacterium]